MLGHDRETSVLGLRRRRRRPAGTPFCGEAGAGSNAEVTSAIARVETAPRATARRRRARRLSQGARLALEAARIRGKLGGVPAPCGYASQASEWIPRKRARGLAGARRRRRRRQVDLAATWTRRSRRLRDAGANVASEISGPGDRHEITLRPALAARTRARRIPRREWVGNARIEAIAGALPPPAELAARAATGPLRGAGQRHRLHRAARRQSADVAVSRASVRTAPRVHAAVRIRTSPRASRPRRSRTCVGSRRCQPPTTHATSSTVSSRSASAGSRDLAPRLRRSLCAGEPQHGLALAFPAGRRSADHPAAGLTLCDQAPARSSSQIGHIAIVPARHRVLGPAARRTRARLRRRGVRPPLPAPRSRPDRRGMGSPTRGTSKVRRPRYDRLA